MVGTNLDKANADFADNAPLYLWANIAITGACAFDYVFSGHDWALETLCLLSVLLNGFALLVRRHEVKRAIKLDIDSEWGSLRIDAEREDRLRRRGLR